MSRRNEFEEVSQLDFNWNSPLLKHLRLCKKIVPKNGEVWIGSRLYDRDYPRIVKLDFKTPPNWEEIDHIKEGQVLDETTFRRFPGERLTHTCHKPYDACVNGYWTKRKRLPPRGE